MSESNGTGKTNQGAEKAPSNWQILKDIFYLFFEIFRFIIVASLLWLLLQFTKLLRLDDLSINLSLLAMMFAEDLKREGKPKLLYLCHRTLFNFCRFESEGFKEAEDFLRAEYEAELQEKYK
jgi:hypothetical protein